MLKVILSLIIFTKRCNFENEMNVTSQIKQPIFKEMELFEKSSMNR